MVGGVSGSADRMLMFTGKLLLGGGACFFAECNYSSYMLINLENVDLAILETLHAYGTNYL